MNIELTEWIVVDGFCATRILVGGDVNNIDDRIAFIEKTPRVRVNQNEWEFGPKGKGGCIEIEGQTIYGFYQPSRDWCDERLTEMGYKLTS